MNEYSSEDLLAILANTVDEESELFAEIRQRFEESDRYRELNK